MTSSSVHNHLKSEKGRAFFMSAWTFRILTSILALSASFMYGLCKSPLDNVCVGQQGLILQKTQPGVTSQSKARVVPLTDVDCCCNRCKLTSEVSGLAR